KFTGCEGQLSCAIGWNHAVGNTSQLGLAAIISIIGHKLHVLLSDMFTEGKWPRTDRRLAKLVAKLFRSSFADDIAAMVVGHTTEERRVRIFQGDTHRVVVQGFNFIDDRKVRCKAGALRI